VYIWECVETGADDRAASYEPNDNRCVVQFGDAKLLKEIGKPLGTLPSGVESPEYTFVGWQNSQGKIATETDNVFGNEVYKPKWRL
jgi:hypothetical protein